eukprot:TRINITY_DN455_c0_g1_i1.p1 TRINITY_DN455_c0_g1~~TRINITY_DN455_c0_g1_i1.p1  ORF type:complete len:191 (+),score=83.59 TRINITY_DN455_c0_g1_i1:23-574(+)
MNKLISLVFCSLFLFLAVVSQTTEVSEEENDNSHIHFSEIPSQQLVEGNADEVQVFSEEGENNFEEGESEKEGLSEMSFIQVSEQSEDDAQSEVDDQVEQSEVEEVEADSNDFEESEGENEEAEDEAEADQFQEDDDDDDEGEDEVEEKEPLEIYVKGDKPVLPSSFEFSVQSKTTTYTDDDE